MRFLTYLSCFLCFAIISTNHAGEIKCATVDVSKLLANYHLAKKKLSSLQVEKYQHEEQHQKLLQEIGKVEEKLKPLIGRLKNDKLSEEKRDDLHAKYNNLTSQYDALNRALEGSHQDLLREIDDNIIKTNSEFLEEIHKAVSKYAKAEKFQWVIDTSGTSNTRISPLLYARDTTEITDEVLVILNEDTSEKKSTDEE